jgi:hypothetical protein
MDKDNPWCALIDRAILKLDARIAALEFKRVTDMLPSFDDMRLSDDAPGLGKTQIVKESLREFLVPQPEDTQVAPDVQRAYAGMPIDQYVDGYQPPKVATEPTRSEQRQYLADWEANLNAKREALDKEIIEFQNCYKQFIAT